MKPKSVSLEQFAECSRIFSQPVRDVILKFRHMSKIEQVEESLQRLLRNGTIFFDNGYDINYRTKQVERVYKELKADLLSHEQQKEMSG